MSDRSGRSPTTSTAPFRSNGGRTCGPASWSGIARSRTPDSGTRSRCSTRPTTALGARRMPATPLCGGPRPTVAVYAIGPTNVDPRTGEILNADVLISAGVDPALARRGGAVRRPSAGGAVACRGLDPSWRRWEGSPCAATATDCGATARLAHALLRRGIHRGAGGMSRRYIGEALKALVMHEIGHTLGLRHNFRGSAGATAAQLADRGWTAEHGLGVSVMDYSPPRSGSTRDPQATSTPPRSGATTAGPSPTATATLGPRVTAGEPRMAKGGGR